MSAISSFSEGQLLFNIKLVGNKIKQNLCSLSFTGVSELWYYKGKKCYVYFEAVKWETTRIWYFHNFLQTVNAT